MTSRRGAEGVRHDTGFCEGLAFSPDGGQMARVTPHGVRLGRGPDARWLFRQGAPLAMNPWGAAFDTTGERVAVGASYARSAEDLVLRVFDLGSGAAREIPLVPPGGAFEAYEWGVIGLVFAPDGALLTGGYGGIRRVDVETGRWEWVWRADGPSDLRLDLAPDGRTLLALVSPWEVEGRVAGRLMALDLGTRRARAIPSHGLRLSSVAFSPSGHAIVTGDAEGVVRVGPSDGGEPHLLTGHAAPVASVAVSPDGLWIASASGNEIRLWPMPDLSRPPSHTLPHGALIARLGGMTNLRVVEDGAAATGYSLVLGPFPGWKDVPTW